MKIVWSIRSFLDYRVPVFRCLNEVAEGNFKLVFPDTRIPERVREKIKDEIGDNAVELTGEKTLGTKNPIAGKANSSWLFTYQPGLAKLIHGLSPDVTIGDGFGQWSVPLIKRRIFRRTPFVMCYERTKHTERNAQSLRRIYRRQMCRWVDAACVNGRLTREYLNEFGISDDRITTGFMASESNVAAKAERLDQQQQLEIRKQHDLAGQVFLFVGRLVEPKGVLQMLEAWKAFTAELKTDSVTLALAGEGDQREAIEDICKSNNLSNVKVLGAIPYDEIHKIYAAADLLLMPTLEDNWSLVAAEAMSCGLPVINSKYNGCWPELTHDGKTGWVFDPLDPSNFLSAIKTAYQHRDQLDAMGKQCKEVVSHYTPESAAQAIYQACEIAAKKKQK